MARQPKPKCADWSDQRWQSWAVGFAKEEGVIRIGELIEPRSNGSFHIPAYIPFIRQGKSIIIQSGKDPVKAVALLQSLVVRTAVMLPHQSRYVLLDPAGAGIAFPMRRYLPLVRRALAMYAVTWTK